MAQPHQDKKYTYSRKHSKFELIIGPMYSAKSSTLIAKIKRYTTQLKCCIIKHSIDTRYTTGNEIITHSGDKYNSVPIIITNDLAVIDDIIGEYDVIGIDELQFYKSPMYILKWLGKSKHVIACGLDGDANGHPFGDIHLLVPHADKITKLNAMCDLCGYKATYTMKRPEYNADHLTSQIDIGGKEKYIAVCRECFFDP
jgi:thymidine kinase